MRYIPTHAIVKVAKIFQFILSKLSKYKNVFITKKNLYLRHISIYNNHMIITIQNKQSKKIMSKVHWVCFCRWYFCQFPFKQE